MIKRIFKLVFLIALSNSLVRINIWHDHLKQMCLSRGGSFYQEILDNQQNLSLHLISFHNSETSNQLEKCLADENSKQKLQLFIDSVQYCMEEQNRMLEDQKTVFINKLLEVLCQLFLLGGGKVDNHCMNITEVNLSLCRQEFNEFPTILLPLIYNTEECREARNLLDCFENGIQDCNDTIKSEFEAANNVTFYTLYGCQYIESTYKPPDFDENNVPDSKSEIENQTGIRFNFTVIESSTNSEKIENLKAIYKDLPVVRFNFTKPELRERCSEKGEEFTKDVGNSFSEFLTIKKDKEFSITSLVKIRRLTEKNDIEDIINEHCYSDLDVRNTLEQIFNAVQQCLYEEDRLEDDKKEILINKSIYKFCSGLDITTGLFPIDQECFQDTATFFQLASCNRNISAEEFYFDSLPLLFISSPEECNDLYRNQNCKLNVHEDCKNSTKNWLQEQFNEERRFIGCEDVLYDIPSKDLEISIKN